MALIQLLLTYFHYLIHPFKTHEMLMHPEGFPDEQIMRLSAYESLCASWIFVIINGIIRIIILNYVLLFLYQLAADSDFEILGMVSLNDSPGLYFILLSSILDIIFYPLFGIFLIQFWEFVIRFFGKMNGTQGDLTQKAQDIMAVKLSSKILTLIPFIGGSIEGFASMILMYAGLRKQLHTSVPLTLCVLFTPILLVLIILSMFLTLALVLV